MNHYVAWMDDFVVGQEVLDDLTGMPTVIVRIQADENRNVGIWVDSSYLDGGRHPWEISPISDLKK